MTVRELIAKLSVCDQNALVVQAKDSEGNGFSPTDAADERRYVADTSYSGDLADDDEGDDEATAVPAVVLWPTN